MDNINKYIYSNRIDVDNNVSNKVSKYSSILDEIKNNKLDNYESILVITNIY